MEMKHSHSLKKLFWLFEDNIKDAKYLAEYADECKEHGNTEMAQYFLSEAKTRIDKNESVKSKIDAIVREHKDDDSPYKCLYDWKIQDYKYLRDKIMQMNV